MNLVNVFVGSLNTGKLCQSFSVQTVLMYQSATSLHSLSAATVWVSRISCMSLKYLSISSGRFSSKLGATCSCRAGKFAKGILGLTGGGFTAGYVTR